MYTIYCITKYTASVCAKFSYFLSLWSHIPFLGTVTSEAQYTTMVPDFHLILTSLWLEKSFCNTFRGLMHIVSKQRYYITLYCDLLLFETTLQNLVCGYHIVQGSVNKYIISCWIHVYLPIGILKEFSTPPRLQYAILPTIQQLFKLNLATSFECMLPKTVHGNCNVQGSTNNHGTKLPPPSNLLICM